MSTNEGELRMRQIKASEVKPGMRVRFEMDGWHVEGTVSLVEPVIFGLEFYSTQGVEMTLGEDTPVTVLAEAQPEEPTAFGARVVADGHEFLLSHGGRRSWKARLDGKRYAWTDLCDMGSVVVIDATPSWTVPEQATETPEVPERIEEWPEDDTALRPYPWRDRDGDTWKWIASASAWVCRDAVDDYVESGGRPSSGPWTRVPHA